jgi:hypothetical protein
VFDTKAISKKWLKIAPIYYRFVDSPEAFDWSEQAALEAYLLESQGIGKTSRSIFEQNKNGYVLGKKWMDATIKMWISNLNDCLLSPQDLYKDFRGFEWFLDRFVGSHPRVQAYRCGKGRLGANHV